MSEWILLILGFLYSFVIGCILGAMAERWQWNKLIKEGKLPKPPNKED